MSSSKQSRNPSMTGTLFWVVSGPRCSLSLMSGTRDECLPYIAVADSLLLLFFFSGMFGTLDWVILTVIVQGGMCSLLSNLGSPGASNSCRI